jgi:hypothetical protein
MTGQPPKSLSLLLAELELSMDECLNGRPIVLMLGTFNEMCVPGAVIVLFIPRVVIVVELCMLAVVNVPLVPRGVASALMLGVLKGVKEVGGVVVGGGWVLGEAGVEGGGELWGSGTPIRF